MKRCRWSLLLLLLCLAAAEPDSSLENLERNRRLLEKWRADPDHYARLQRDLQAFWALPPERRERLRQLDRELHQASGAEQKRLWAVLDRYSTWLERLPEVDRQRLDATTDQTEKLRQIKEIRERQWLDRLPAKVQDDLRNLPADKQLDRLESLHKEEQQNRLVWRRPRVLRPAHLTEFPQEVQAFIDRALRPRLNAEEQERLKAADGRPQLLARTLLALSEKHPVLPPLPAGPVTRYPELPPTMQRWFPRAQLEKTGRWKDLEKIEGKWPDFALAFAEMARHEGMLQPPPLGASRPREFPPPVPGFIAQRLPQVLTKAEWERLKRTEGKWPDYPRLLLELAGKHHLYVPGMTLPGPRDLWDLPRPGG